MKRSLAIFIPLLEGGGAERVLLHLMEALILQGVEIDLVLADACHPYNVLLKYVPRQVNIVNLQAYRTLAALPSLIKYLRAKRPDTLLSTMTHANIMVILAKYLAGIRTRVVVISNTNHSLDSAYDKRLRLLPLFIRVFYPFADEIVAVSEGVSEDLQKIAHVNPAVIYNPVPIEKIQMLAAQPVIFAFDKPTFLAVGRLVPAKDYPTLLRAFSKVKVQCDSHLLILGEGQERAELESLAKTLGIAVTMPGFVENPYAYMSRASMLVMSSAYEGFANVLVEAMACGCPVVSTNCPSGPAEILQNGTYGRLVPVGDVDALAAAMTETLNNPFPREILQKRASDFSIDKIIGQYLDVLHL